MHKKLMVFNGSYPNIDVNGYPNIDVNVYVGVPVKKVG